MAHTMSGQSDRLSIVVVVMVCLVLGPVCWEANPAKSYITKLNKNIKSRRVVGRGAQNEVRTQTQTLHQQTDSNFR